MIAISSSVTAASGNQRRRSPVFPVSPATKPWESVNPRTLSPFRRDRVRSWAIPAGVKSGAACPWIVKPFDTVELPDIL